MDVELLKKHGIDYDTGLERCMGDEAFYERYIMLFMQDDSFQRAKNAFQAGDYKAMFQCLHELKGASGNCALTELYNAVCPLVELLRGDGEPSPAELQCDFDKVESAYVKACEGISLTFGI